MIYEVILIVNRPIVHQISVLGSVITPVTAAAAATSGLASSVREPGPWRPSKLRLLVDTAYFPAGTLSSFIASLGLNISGEKFEAAASGNGPVDAAIKALKKIIDRHMTLKEFTIQAISKGSDDMGKVHMQVEYDNHIYYGFGANTDIIAASVEAYIDCINKFKM